MTHAVAVTAALLALVRALGMNPLPPAETWVQDTMRTVLPTPLPEEPAVTLVELDDASLQEMGLRWPVERETLARLLAVVCRYGPKAVAVDLLVDQASTGPNQRLVDDVMAALEAQHALGTPTGTAVMAALRQAGGDADPDIPLARAIAACGNVVLGAAGTSQAGGPVPLLGTVAGVPHPALQLAGVVTPLPGLAAAAAATAVVNILVDSDGVVRRYPYVAQSPFGVHPSLALAAVQQAGLADSVAWQVDDGAPSPRVSTLLRYIPRVSAVDVLAGRGPLDTLFRGRVILLGTAATGVGDNYVLRDGTTQPGVRIHAAAAAALLHGAVLEAKGTMPWWSLLEVLVMAALAFFLFARVEGMRALLVWGLVLVGAHMMLVVAALLGPGLVLPVMVPAWMVVCMTGTALWERTRILRWQERALLAERDRATAQLRSLERFETMVVNLREGLAVLDGTGRISLANPALCRLLAKDAASLVGTSLGMHVQGLAAQDASGELYEATAQTPHGLVPVAVSLSELPMAGTGAWVAVIQDISERRAAEQLKEQFLATVTHELRTPLTSIKGALGLLHGGAVGPMPERSQPLLLLALNNVERLQRLVNDILDAAKLAAGRMDLRDERVDLAALARDCVAANQPYAQQFNATYVLQAPEQPVLVQGDPDRLVQVLTNLLSNAAKFSPPGAQVQVQVDQVGTHARVRVHDAGPGIPAHFRAQLFERFVQLPQPDGTRKAGTGLGLSISHALMEAMGGRLDLDGGTPGGACFFLELPLAAPPLLD